MGKIFQNEGGGAVDLSFLTIGASDILSGYFSINVDAEKLTGVMTNQGAKTSSLNAGGSYTIPAGYHNGSGIISANSLLSQTNADATTGDILSSQTAWVNGSQLTGSMANQGSKSTSLNASGSYTIPAGYHDGTGKITANTLASQTSGTAAASHILSGKTAWVGGSQLTGTLAVQNISSVTATTQSATVIRISWKNPAKGPYTGVKVFMSTSGNPGTGGTAKYTGTGSSTTASGTSYVDITGLSGATKYYFTVCAYVTNVGNGTASNVNATTKAAAGSKTFTSSGTFTVPAGVTSIDIFCVGGGASGGSIATPSGGGKRFTGGGGSGKTATKKAYTVTPGSSFTVTIGAGGSTYQPTGYTDYTAAGSGGTTSFGSVISASGGVGSASNSSSGANGGSGGGSRGSISTSSGAVTQGGAGGSDGSDGTAIGYQTAGTGQHTTTRSYGETSGTLYAGGGSGGAYSSNTVSGGAGGGGSSYGLDQHGGNGTANTGGGGGGLLYNSSSTGTKKIGGAGGSGICLVRWS